MQLLRLEIVSKENVVYQKTCTVMAEQLEKAKVSLKRTAERQRYSNKKLNGFKTARLGHVAKTKLP